MATQRGTHIRDTKALTGALKYFVIDIGHQGRGVEIQNHLSMPNALKNISDNGHRYLAVAVLVQEKQRPRASSGVIANLANNLIANFCEFVGQDPNAVSQTRPISPLNELLAKKVSGCPVDVDKNELNVKAYRFLPQQVDFFARRLHNIEHLEW